MQAFTRAETIAVADELRDLDKQMLNMMRVWTCEVGACQCCIATETPEELMETMIDSFPKYCVGIGSAMQRLAQRLEDVYGIVDQAAREAEDSKSIEVFDALDRVRTRDPVRNPSLPCHERMRTTRRVTHVTERLDNRKRSRHEDDSGGPPAELFTRSFGNRIVH